MLEPHIKGLWIWFSIIYSAYLQGRMKLASSSRPISSLIRSYVFGLNFLADCLYGLKPAFIGNRCSTSSRLNPGISWYSHAKQQTYSFNSSINLALQSAFKFLFINVGRVTEPSPISTSSNGSADVKPYPSLSMSSNSSIDSYISFSLGRYFKRHFCNHSELGSI